MKQLVSIMSDLLTNMFYGGGVAPFQWTHS